MKIGSRHFYLESTMLFRSKFILENIFHAEFGNFLFFYFSLLPWNLPSKLKEMKMIFDGSCALFFNLMSMLFHLTLVGFGTLFRGIHWNPLKKVSVTFWSNAFDSTSYYIYFQCMVDVFYKLWFLLMSLEMAHS